MRGHTVGYWSSYDRGLDMLLDLWPKIREAVPDATLTIAYGWNVYDAVHKGNGAMGAWKWRMIRKMHDLKDQGVKELGRVSHIEQAKLLKQTKVWAYPTEFNEINCITALKVQEAGCIPVTTACYALRETIRDHTFSAPSENIYTDEAAQAEFVKQVVAALGSDHVIEPVPGIDWKDIAKVWNDALTG